MTNLAIDYGAETSPTLGQFEFSCEANHTQKIADPDTKNGTNLLPSFNNDFRYLSVLSDNSDLINGGGVNLDGYRLSFDRGVLEYDNGLLLAVNPASHNSKWSCGNASSSKLVRLLIEEMRSQFQGQFRVKAYSDLMDCLVANLLYAEKKHCQLLVSRDKNKSTLAFIACCDFLLDNGYSIGAKGCSDEFRGVRSWMIPSSKLLNMAKREDIKIKLAENAPMVKVRDDKGKEVALSTFRRTEAKRAINRLSKPVQQYNEMMLEHVVSLPDGREFNCFLHRVFNLKKLDLGGRFYGSDHQSLLKSERKQLLIDGQPTVEPDFKSLHPCMLYAWEGIQLDPLQDDPYTVDGFPRDMVKLAMLVLVNAKRPQDVATAITNSTKPQNIAKMEAYEKARAQYEADRIEHVSNIIKGKRPKSLPVEPKRPFKISDKGSDNKWKSKGEQLFINARRKLKPYHKPINCVLRIPTDLTGIGGYMTNIDGKALVKSLLERHKPISHLFGTESLGLKLQFVDSQIMAATIQQLTALNIPALPVHDSLRCKASDCDAVMYAMRSAYKAITGFDGCVTLD
ncbi:hypothetical protein [Vibrio alfacsensis]|uniref:hypothetical protein n=1 Tax=Vibrio alfacsensis TaxID=1074311 RepID=UPI0040693CB7